MLPEAGPAGDRASASQTFLRSGRRADALGAARALPAGHRHRRVRAPHDARRPEAARCAVRASTRPPAKLRRRRRRAAATAQTRSGEVTVEDFAKLDLRIAKIVAAEAVEGADKLLKLTLDIGDGQRTVFAGIRSAYAPEQLPGRSRWCSRISSRARCASARPKAWCWPPGPGGKDIFLLSPDSGRDAGDESEVARRHVRPCSSFCSAACWSTIMALAQHAAVAPVRERRPTSSAARALHCDRLSRGRAGVALLGWLLARFVLAPWHLEYLRTPAFVAVVLIVVPLAGHACSGARAAADRSSPGSRC